MNNNKGFAVSTLLYGMLAILIIIMAFLVSSLRTKRNISKSITDNIVLNLNNCAEKLAQYRICLTEEAKNKNCSIEESQYNLCLNIESFESAEGISVQRLRTELEKSGKIEKINNRYMLIKPLYVFRGENINNNHVMYENKRGRIIYFTNNNIMKVLFDDGGHNKYTDVILNTNLANISDVNFWTSSFVYNYLNTDYKLTFNNINLFHDSITIGVGSLYNKNYNIFFTLDEKSTEDSLYSLIYGYYGKKTNKNSQSSDSLFSLFSVADLFLTSRCDLNNYISNSCINTSWLNKLEKSWTINKVHNEYSLFTNKMDISPSNQILRIYPVVHFRSVTKIIGGTGSESDPYILG
jgi:hypothetical protein